MASKETDKFLKNLKKTKKYDGKIGVKFLKYTQKIKKAEDYEDYVKEYIKIPIIEWILQVLIIRPVIIFLALILLSTTSLFLNHPTQLVFVAEGTSILWYLFIELVNELKQKVK